MIKFGMTMQCCLHNVTREMRDPTRFLKNTDRPDRELGKLFPVENGCPNKKCKWHKKKHGAEPCNIELFGETVPGLHYFRVKGRITWLRYSKEHLHG